MLFAEEIITLQCGLVVAVGALASVVAALWARNEARFKDCEEDRKRLWSRLADLAPQTCTDGSCPDRQHLHTSMVQLSTDLSERGKKQLKPGDA